MQFTPVIFAYFTPETVLPAASVIAAGFGFVLLVVRAPFRVVKQWFRRVAKRPQSQSSPKKAGL